MMDGGMCLVGICMYSKLGDEHAGAAGRDSSAVEEAFDDGYVGRG